MTDFSTHLPEHVTVDGVDKPTADLTDPELREAIHDASRDAEIAFTSASDDWDTIRAGETKLLEAMALAQLNEQRVG